MPKACHRQQDPRSADAATVERARPQDGMHAGVARLSYEPRQALIAVSIASRARRVLKANTWAVFDNFEGMQGNGFPGSRGVAGRGVD